ncbi:MAG: DUF3127 domain-containing protein [Rikenellaceae bacterium]
MEFQGTVFRIMPENRGTTARGDWQRQEVIFTMMEGAYERKVAVTFFNKPTEVQGLQEGATYNVAFNVESREYNERWYTDIRAGRVTPVAAGAPAPQAAPAQPAPQQAAPAPATQTEEVADDLPF